MTSGVADDRPISELLSFHAARQLQVPMRFLGRLRSWFDIELNRDGKKRAANLGVPESHRAARRVRNDGPVQWSLASALAIPGFMVVYFVVAARHPVSWWIALGYVVLSVVCFMAYAFDKSAARAGRWRSSEQSLLVVGLMGGRPGGLIAQQLLRHKSSKVSFRAAFWGTVAVNIAAFVVYHLFIR